MRKLGIQINRESFIAFNYGGRRRTGAPRMKRSFR